MNLIIDFIVGIWMALVTVVLSVIVPCVAKSRNRSAAGWFFVGFFLSPYVALLILAALRDKEKIGKTENESVIDKYREP